MKKRLNPAANSHCKTVRHGTELVEGCFPAQTALNMAARLCRSVEKKWRRSRGYKHLAEVIDAVNFIDGISKRS